MCRILKVSSLSQQKWLDIMPKVSQARSRIFKSYLQSYTKCASHRYGQQCSVQYSDLFHSEDNPFTTLYLLAWLIPDTRCKPGSDMVICVTKVCFYNFVKFEVMLISG